MYLIIYTYNNICIYIYIHYSFHSFRLQLSQFKVRSVMGPQSPVHLQRRHDPARVTLEAQRFDPQGRFGCEDLPLGH